MANRCPEYVSHFYPKYKYDYRATYYPQNSVIVGYEVTESIEIKVRDIDSAVKLIEGLGAVGVVNLYGPNFSIDDVVQKVKERLTR